MEKSKPNILLIMSDQHRIDCVGAYGNRDIRTPHIDKLAKDGVLYENSFCAAPICTPSRYSLITGQYPHQHQGYNNHCNIPEGIDTFPQILKQNGYRTKAVGKMHFTPTYLDVGFEQMELAEQNGPGRFEDDYHRYLREQGLCDRVDLTDQVNEYRKQAPQSYWDCLGAIESDLPEKHHSTTWIGEKALTSIDQWEEEEANLLMVSFVKPHHPFDPPAPWSEMYDPAELSLLPGWTEECFEHDLSTHSGFFPHASLTEEKLKQVMAYYYGAISQIDAYVGRMIAMLQSKGMYKDTVIVYTSDHGEYMGFHHMLLKNNNMYDPLVKVPLIVKYPGQHGHGTRSNALINNIDLAPTLLRQAGCPESHFMAGSDLLNEHAAREYVITEQGRGRQYMVRSHTHKLLLSNDEDKSLFFDLQNDSLEMNNVYDDPTFASLIQKHKEALYRMVLFDAPPPVNLSLEASCIKGDNVPTKDDKDDLSAWVRSEFQIIS